MWSVSVGANSPKLTDCAHTGMLGLNATAATTGPALQDLGTFSVSNGQFFDR